MKAKFLLSGLIGLILLGCGSTEQEAFSRDDTTKIVTDNKTKLQWQDNEGAASDDRLSRWKEAVEYCNLLTLGGQSDWRLPNMEELSRLADVKVEGKRKMDPAIDSMFQHVVPALYWSSTSVAGDENSAWYVNFFYSGAHRGKKENQYFVRCVRG